MSAMERLLITETEELKKKSIEDLPWPGRAGDGRAGGDHEPATGEWGE